MLRFFHNDEIMLPHVEKMTNLFLGCMRGSYLSAVTILTNMSYKLFFSRYINTNSCIKSDSKTFFIKGVFVNEEYFL